MSYWQMSDTEQKENNKNWNDHTMQISKYGPEIENKMECLLPLGGASGLLGNVNIMLVCRMCNVSVCVHAGYVVRCIHKTYI